MLTIRVDHHFHWPGLPADPRIDEILNLLEHLMTTQAETKAILEEIAANLTEASSELTGKIDDLSAQLAAAGHNTPEVDALLSAIRAKAQALADVVPDPADPPADPVAP